MRARLRPPDELADRAGAPPAAGTAAPLGKEPPISDHDTSQYAGQISDQATFSITSEVQ